MVRADTDDGACGGDDVVGVVMTFSYRVLVSNEVGRMFWAEPQLEARDEAEARSICAENGWEFQWEILETIPAGPELDEALNLEVERRDAEWTGEGGA